MKLTSGMSLLDMLREALIMSILSRHPISYETRSRRTLADDSRVKNNSSSDWGYQRTLQCSAKVSR